jgi:hypothetical protein
VTKPAPVPARPAPAPPANAVNNSSPRVTNNALLNLLHGGNNATPSGQQPARNNNNLLQNKMGVQTPGTQNTGAQNIFQKTSFQTTGTQKAGAPLNGTRMNAAQSSGSQVNGARVAASANHVSPAMANRPNGRSVPSQNFVGHPGPAGSVETHNRNGDIVRKAADGSVIDVRSPKNGMLIHYALNGNRRVVAERPDHSRVVAASRGLQYVQHPYNFGGHTYNHRTFYVQGKVFHQLYRPYSYGGTNLDVYATSRYYEPKFYEWATSHQNTAQPFTWTYATNSPPWFAHYKGYFTPDSSYTSPTLWLTDFLLASSLSSHYQNNAQTASDLPPADGSAGITPEVKQAVAEEVKWQVKQESTEAQQNAQHREPQAGAGSVVNEISDRQQHTFVVDSDLDLVDPSGRRCMISEGDVVQVNGGPEAGTGIASAIVLASKGGVECGRATQVEIALADLQEMQNHMRETIDQGMANTNAGKSASSVTPEFAKAVPPADSNAGNEIEQEQQLAAAADG